MTQAQPQRYRIRHDGDVVGITHFEGGDPDTRGVSGVVHNQAGAKALAMWIMSIGGAEDAGAVYIELGDAFAIEDEAGDALTFDEATLIALPGEEEAYIDVAGVPDDSYRERFMHHLQAAGTPTGD